MQETRELVYMAYSSVRMGIMYSFMACGALMATAEECVLKSKSLYLVESGVTLTIALGDITQNNSEAIVNAANPQLVLGGGVCGALFKAAGEAALQEACFSYELKCDGIRCPVGESRITGSYGLKRNGSEYIIHTVGPDCRVILAKEEQDSLLASAYQSALSLAMQHDLCSIAFPFISSGIYSFPKKRAAVLALTTISLFLRWHRNESRLKRVSIILWDRDDYDLFCDLVANELIV